jgi:DNA (cytosine-5)-methyltransferase 1
MPRRGGGSRTPFGSTTTTAPGWSSGTENAPDDRWMSRALSIQAGTKGSGPRLTWKLHTNRGQEPDGTRQVIDPAERPAPTLTAKSGGQWVYERPTTTVQGDPRIAQPGHRDREGGERQFEGESVRVTVQEAAILQSFPPDYPWQGTKSAQFRQVGDAVPPLLAAHVIAACLGVQVAATEEAA